MNKYVMLWEWIKVHGTENFTLTFAEIEQITGFSIDHSFLNAKNELQQYGYQVSKISMKKQTVQFQILKKDCY